MNFKYEYTCRDGAKYTGNTHYAVVDSLISGKNSDWAYLYRRRPSHKRYMHDVINRMRMTHNDKNIPYARTEEEFCSILVQFGYWQCSAQELATFPVA